MNKIYCLLLLFSYAFAAEISSDHISFNGDILLLDGKVKLSSPLGTLTSAFARLKKESRATDLIFSKAILKENVHIFLKKNGHITCDLARLDFSTLLGDLNAFTGYVTYEEKKRPLSIIARAINFKMIRAPDFDIDNLIAIGFARASINNLYTLTAERMSYHKFIKRAPEGILRAYHNPEFLSENLQLRAYSMMLDLRTFYLQMTSVDGTIVSEGDTLSFVCGRLSYDLKKNSALLKDQAIVYSPKIGLLEAKEEISIHKNMLGKVDSVKTKGPMTYRHLGHTLSTAGKLHLNQMTGTLTVEEGELCYENETFSVYSNRGKIEYSEGIDLVNLEGDILVLLHKSEGRIERALCDYLTYKPHEHLLRLVAKPGNKVHLWNEEESLEFMADEIELSNEGDRAVHCIGPSKCILQ